MFRCVKWVNAAPQWVTWSLPAGWITSECLYGNCPQQMAKCDCYDDESELDSFAVSHFLLDGRWWRGVAGWVEAMWSDHYGSFRGNYMRIWNKLHCCCCPVLSLTTDQVSEWVRKHLLSMDSDQAGIKTINRTLWFRQITHRSLLLIIVISSSTGSGRRCIFYWRSIYLSTPLHSTLQVVSTTGLDDVVGSGGTGWHIMFESPLLATANLNNLA